MRFLAFVAAATSLLVGAPALASAGWTARSVQKSSNSQAEQNGTMVYGEHQLRVDDGRGNVMVIDLKNGDMTMMREATKTYAKVPLKKLVDMQKAMLAEMRKKLSSVPENMRATLAKQLDAQERASKERPKPVKTKDTAKVAGHACEVYQWKAPEGQIEACLAKKTKVDTAAFKADLKTLARNLEKSGLSAGATSMVLLQVGEIGFPLRTVRKMSFGDRTMTMTSEVVSLEATKTSPQDFKVPSGFVEKPFEELMGGRPPAGP